MASEKTLRRNAECAEVMATEMNPSWSTVPIAGATYIRGKLRSYAMRYQISTPVFPDWVKIRDDTSKHLEECLSIVDKTSCLPFFIETNVNQPTTAITSSTTPLIML